MMKLESQIDCNFSIIFNFSIDVKSDLQAMLIHVIEL